MSLGLVSMVIALAAADRSIGGVIVPMILFDCGAQLYAVSNSYRVAGIDPKARARLNGCVLFCMFVGQVSDVHTAHRLGVSTSKSHVAHVIDCRDSHPYQDIQLARLASNGRYSSGIHGGPDSGSPCTVSLWSGGLIPFFYTSRVF
jgi:hypothetical protein